jgi:hypothetical protein
MANAREREREREREQTNYTYKFSERCFDLGSESRWIAFQSNSNSLLHQGFLIGCIATTNTITAHAIATRSKAFTIACFESAKRNKQ